MKKIVVILSLFFCAFSFGQSSNVNEYLETFNSNGQIVGTVLDAENKNEPLAFASVKIEELNVSVLSDINGTFMFKLKPGTYKLEFSFIGYNTIEAKKITVVAGSTTTLKQELNALKLKTDLATLELK